MGCRVPAGAQRERLACQQQPHGKDRALVGIHAARRREHRPLCREALRAQGSHQRPRRASIFRQSKRGHAREMRAEHFRTFAEQRKVHIPVRTVVVPVHQAGLGRCLHLRDERLAGKRREALRRKAGKETVRAGRDLRKAVRPAAGASRHRAAADDAAPLRPAGELLSIRADHVDVEQARSRVRLLNGNHAALGFLRADVKHEKRLAARLFQPKRPMQRRRHRGFDAAHALGKRKRNERRTLHFPGDVHRKTNNGPCELLHQRPLLLRPALARREHFIQCDL